MPVDDFFIIVKRHLWNISISLSISMLVRSCCYDVYTRKQENLKLGSSIQDC